MLDLLSLRTLRSFSNVNGRENGGKKVKYSRMYEPEVSGSREQEAFHASDRYPNYLGFFFRN